MLRLFKFKSHSQPNVTLAIHRRARGFWQPVWRGLINLCGLHIWPRFAHHAFAGKDAERCGLIRKQLVFGVLLLLVFDPFELQEATLTTSDLVADRLSATTYIAPSADKIAVVLVDDAALNNSNADWPPDFPFWSDLLGMLLLHHPAAVYLDFSFDYPRASFTTPQDGPATPDSERAADEAAMFAGLISGGFNGKPVPVVLGSLGRLAARRQPLSGCANPTRDGERSSVIPVLACAAAETDFYDYPQPSDQRGYPLWTAWKYNGSVAVSRLPAAALAARACQVLHPALVWCGTKGTAWLSMPGMLRRPDNEAVIPQWSLYARDEATPPNQANDDACTRYRPGGWWAQHWTWIKTFFSEALAGPLLRAPLVHMTEIQNAAGTTSEPCMPFPVISAAILMDHTGAFSPALTELLQDRIVLIGDGRRYSPDYVVAPLHKNLPGVMLQATVLETLLTRGKNFPKISNKLRFRQYVYETSTKIGILLLAIGLDMIAEKKREELTKAPNQYDLGSRVRQALWGKRNVAFHNKWLSRLGLRFLLNNALNVLFALTGIIVIVALLLWRQAPANWIFLICEILLISLGLGELRAPGHEDEEKDPHSGVKHSHGAAK